jgi:hypothetical protein
MSPAITFNFKVNLNLNINGGGQECPLYIRRCALQF